MNLGQCTQRGLSLSKYFVRRYERGNVQVTWGWWTLNATSGQQPVAPLVVAPGSKGANRSRLRVPMPAPPDIDEWGLDDPDATILFGSGAHNMRYGSVDQYEEHLRSFVSRYRRKMPVHARAFWLVGAAHHVNDDDLDCQRDRPVHLMSHHRSQLFSAIGAEVMRAVVPLFDMWKLTADQAANCANVHYDELYVSNRSQGDGLVSHAVANLLLNVACNPRLLPASEIRTEI